MKVYVVCHTETGGYIGHGLYEEWSVEDGIYSTKEKAEEAVAESEYDCWIIENEVM